MKKTLLFCLILICSHLILNSQTTFAPIQKIDGPPGELTALDSGSLIGGTGYVDATAVPVTSSTGIGAKVDIVTSSGVVTMVIINNIGAFYEVGETLTITGGNGNATIDVLTVDEGFVGIDPTIVVSGDLDGDTDIDIAIGTYNYLPSYTPTQDYIKWYQNDGSGNFTLQTSVSESVLWVQSLIIADVDVNNVNGNDIVATVAVGSKLVYYPNDGSGGFGSEVVISNTITDPGQVVSGDINNDGNLDLITVSYIDNESIWFAGDGNGNFTEQTSSPIQSGGSGGPFYLDVADFDGDTDLDVLVGFYNDQNIEIYYNQYIESGTNTVSWVKDAVSVDTGNSFLGIANKEIAFADVNNDGVLDVIKCNNANGDVTWFSKIKNGASTPNPISSSIARPATVVVADLDNDTYNDVIVTDGASVSKSIVWFKGASNASPSTTESLIVDNNFQYWSITIDDFDGDTDKDIAAVGVFSNTLDWYENEWNLLGIEDNSIDKVKVFPNPVKNQLHFKGFSENTELAVYDIMGHSVLNTTLQVNTPLDVSKLYNGIYLIKFKDYNSTFKFVKQ